ncbi:MAG: NADH-quinone oxidoreductase subunit NuoE [Dehalococcoidales bacterium]|nr:NADH-quinone oxidoreductase subunit NuoE [Dehalococcoidales bacterium]
MAVREFREKTRQVLKKYQQDKSALIDILHDTQAAIGYLPREALEEIARGLGIPLSQVYSVVTFFKAFSLEPRGRHLIQVCMGTACHVRGADKVLAQIEKELGVKAGANTADLRFTLQTVNCVGSCALGPVVIVDQDYYGEMAPEKVSGMLGNYS